jgi:nucleotide-binding universal stress UspA family protein
MKLLYLSIDQMISSQIAAYVADVASRTESSVTLFVVADKEGSVEMIQKQISQIEEVITVPLEVKLKTGDPISLILEEIKAGDYDIAIMAIRQRRRVVPSAYRILSQKIIKQSPIPIMLVRDAAPKLERVLVCTGGQDISVPVVEFSANLAGLAGLKATLLYVTGAVPSMYTGMYEMEEKLEELLETDTPLAKHLRTSAEVLAQRNVEAQIEIRQGDVAETILQEAEKGDIDLIVLGVSGSSTLAGMLLGNVTQQIINHACCAVLIVK